MGAPSVIDVYTAMGEPLFYGLSSAASTTARGRKQCSACGMAVTARSNTTQSTSASICGEEHRGGCEGPPRRKPATSAILLVLVL